jgi:hypothetical protein
MRLVRVFSVSALVFAAVSPLMLYGQFREPTREELQMTADPKAPGADAVYLYREEKTDDALHYHSYYERIKVLTEKGKEAATIRIPYERSTFKVTDIHGRTIHSDGTVIPLTTKPDDLVDVKTRDVQFNTMVFTLPSVEVGSILEYSLEIRYDDTVVNSPTWAVQQPYFVHQAHYFFNPSKSGYISNSRGEVLDQLMWAVRARDDSKVNYNAANGNYTFDISDVPAIPKEDWMPPLNSINWRVEFYYTRYRKGTEFWETEGKRWAKEAENFAKPTKAIQQAVSQIVSPSDNEEQKAHKIYDAVMKLENTRFTRQKSEAERKKENLKQIKSAEDVWNQKGGTDDNIALLYVAMAKAAGLKAYPMKVVDRSRAIFDVNYLSLSQLDDYIAIVEIGGKEVYLDPGQKMCPFGILHWRHTMAGGLRLSDKGPVYGMTPASTYKENLDKRYADLTLEADGNVTGTVRYILTGQAALRWRQLSLRNDLEEVKKQFKEAIRDDIPDGLEVEFDHFLALDDPNENLIALLKLTGNMGTATGKRFFMPGFFFESRGKHPFVAEDKRSIPVDVQYPAMITEDVTYRLPDGVGVENSPQASNAIWPDHALVKVGSAVSGQKLEVARSLAYNYTLLAADQYANLHDFYQKVATADQQQIVLTKAAIAKGN